MHQSVIDRWEEFSRPLEGRVDAMYVDVLGLVTCGVGNLVDPIGQAERLPWTLEDGSRADLAQVRADWHLLKNASAHYAKLHWKYARAATKCRLTEQAIDGLVAAKRAEFETFVRTHYFKDFDSFPADAQLGIMSMAWACGPGFPLKFGNFRNAVLKQDWDAAVATCKIREGTPGKADWNPGIVPRNKLNRFLFANAARVKANGIDDNAVLYWPSVAPNSSELERAAQSQAKTALDQFTANEWERFISEGPSAARDLRLWEEPDHERHDTDPAPAPNSERS